jgi:methionyl-tRNA synthetase
MLSSLRKVLLPGMAKKFYITTAIPYVNAPPHVGHSLEFVQADCIAKYHRLLGEDVTLLSGGDENALKNVQAAETAGIPVGEFIDTNTQLFKTLAEKLNVQFDVFQKGSDTKHHYPASQKLWNLCKANGDIYEKEYSGLYCLGCETFYAPDELNEHGECFEHPGKKLELVSEKNYFFKLSRYQKQLIDLIESDTLHIVPEFRKNEVLSFLKQPLQDISISRSNKRAKNWGVPVPDDTTQRMYVWFDALNIYQSGIGFGWNDAEYKKWWPADVHVIGKGISRFHAVYWPAFLLSAKLALPKKLFVHGYFTVNGQKMSKTLGNVIDPVGLIEKYGADALRYYFLREIPATSDGDFSEARFKELYNADLANGLGNLVSRVITMIIKYYDGKIPSIDAEPDSHPLRMDTSIYNWKNSWTDIDIHMEAYQFHEAIASIWKFIKEADKYIDMNKPWEMAKDNPKKLNWVLYGLADSLHQIAWQIAPFLPDTSRKIAEALGIDTLIVGQAVFKDSWTNIKPGTSVKKIESLFPRLL